MCRALEWNTAKLLSMGQDLPPPIFPFGSVCRAQSLILDVLNKHLSCSYAPYLLYYSLFSTMKINTTTKQLNITTISAFKVHVIMSNVYTICKLIIGPAGCFSACAASGQCAEPVGVACSAKSLVRDLLTIHPSKRLTASQALQHSWFTAALHSNEDLRLARRNMKRHLRQRFKVRHTFLAVWPVHDCV